MLQVRLDFTHRLHIARLILLGNFGARNVPKCLRAIEILGMKQARAWNCGSLNEFRKFFGLKQYDTFEEINRDPYVADQLRRLYGNTCVEVDTS
jgi:hypothetical protein